MGRMTLWAALAVAALTSEALAGPACAAQTKPLFASDEVIRLTIKGPIPVLVQRAATSEKPIAGSLAVQGAAPETLPVALSARGITRRQQDVCTFPPIRVEFPQKPPATSLFRGQKRLKLVTHCRPGEGFQQYVLLEYAAYKLYNLLTPASFDVRLAKIDYVDSDGRPIISRIGYFIEDADDMARRNDMTRFRTKSRVPVAQLNAHDAARFVLFQNMIGNLDWAMTAGPAGTDCCHNARLIGADGATTNFTPVPYDFDFSGMVDAPYATPPAQIKIPNVRVRRYRGYCRHNEEAQAVAADLSARRTSLLAVIGAIPQLDAPMRQKATAYLGGFFDQIGSQAGVADLLKACV
ncbi:hypothetical protein [Phenylobacterium sp.]|uniref:hypothetical protein n=1 Tax=Phenylobacterium sp. TaxID=1871053 RepID=UPI002F4205DD